MDDLEAFLKKHPDDLARREAALDRYARTQNRERLRFHTLQMVQHHPESPRILAANDAAFYRDPAYRAEVIRAMEARVRADRRDHGVYANLARLCEHGAFPVPPDQQAQFRRRYALLADMPVPSRIDGVRANKAVGDWRAARIKAQADIADPVQRKRYVTAYSAALAALLEKLRRPEVPLCPLRPRMSPR